MQGGNFRVHRFEKDAGEHCPDRQEAPKNFHLCGKQHLEAVLMARTLNGTNSGNHLASRGPDRSHALQSLHLPTSATVLLVEDDALVRECLHELLNDIGGRVSDAASAAEALERIAAEGVPDVLVTDLQLGPGAGWPGADRRRPAAVARGARRADQRHQRGRADARPGRPLPPQALQG